MMIMQAAMLSILLLGILPIATFSFHVTTSLKRSDCQDNVCYPLRRHITNVEHWRHQGIASSYDVPWSSEVTLSFPSYQNLMKLQYGECITSDTFVVGTEEFCVKLYPRGGGHKVAFTSIFSNTKPTTTDDDGVQSDGLFKFTSLLTSYLNSLTDRKHQRVGVYLQYLPRRETDSVDATFGLCLQGNQQHGPRFNVEWRAGMRFVSQSKSNLKEGCANDFGAHLLETRLLKSFLGATTDDDDNINNENDNDTPQQLATQLRVDVTIHPPAIGKRSSSSSNSAAATSFEKSNSIFILPFYDIREQDADDDEHNPELVRVGKIVVPLLQRLDQRPRMFQLGAYPGVEYRILRILNNNGQDVFTSKPGVDYDLKPVYPLVQPLERPWPVRVNEREIPKLFTPAMYNALAAIGSITLAVTGLFAAWCISQAVSVFYIPSRSMEPTLQVGDVLLVDKVTPRILVDNAHVGNVVLFLPPSQLRDIIASKGGQLSDRDLFVKRVAAGPGDTVRVEPSGSVQINGQLPDGRRELCEAEPLHLIEQYIQTTNNNGDDDLVVKKGEVFVMGDCSSVSIDSRVWGPLKTSEIVGRPIYRVWPPQRFGSIPPLQSETDSIL